MKQEIKMEIKGLYEIMDNLYFNYNPSHIIVQKAMADLENKIKVLRDRYLAL
jgi:hypothetical protein